MKLLIKKIYVQGPEAAEDLCSNCVLETHCQTNNNVLIKILVLDHVSVICVH